MDSHSAICFANSLYSLNGISFALHHNLNAPDIFKGLYVINQPQYSSPKISSLALIKPSLLLVFISMSGKDLDSSILVVLINLVGYKVTGAIILSMPIISKSLLT